MRYISSVLLCASLVSSSVILNVRADSSGCGIRHSTGYNDGPDTHSIVSGQRTRYYGIYVPESYNDDTSAKRKLILDFHGNNGTPEQQYNNSQYYLNGNGKEYLVVYPAGVEKHWQSAPYAIEGVNDLQFVTDLLQHMRQQYCIDSDHIYASGKSNGGGFVDYLACSDHGDEFAAFAMASAALYSDLSLHSENCTTTKKRAIIDSHGLNDTTIRYDGTGSKNGPLPNIADWISWWAQRDGCDPVSDREDSGDMGGYDLASYSCGGHQNIVQHYNVTNLGHCWPSATGLNSDGARDYCDDYVLDYTSAVVGFFSRYTLGQLS